MPEKQLTKLLWFETRHNAIKDDEDVEVDHISTRNLGERWVIMRYDYAVGSDDVDVNDVNMR